jgi:hypothetical protein
MSNIISQKHEVGSTYIHPMLIQYSSASPKRYGAVPHSLPDSCLVRSPRFLRRLASS